METTIETTKTTTTEVQSLCPTQIANNIGIATLNNPPVNSLSGDLCDALLEAFDKFEKARVRVIILRANPSAKIWSAGHDIRDIPLDGRDAVTWTTGFEQVLRRVRSSPMPVIAMLHTSVWGAACDLSVTCDLAIGTPKTTFAITPVKLGISYNTAGMSHFLGVLPLHIVKEMVFTGNPLSAEDAYRLGLLNRLVSPDKLEATTMEIAGTIASRAPLAVSVVKAELSSLSRGAPLSADEFESIQGARRAAFRSDDLKEGVKSFFEKRIPVFQGT
jgi:methylmalonyl-CoA decarboxylase